MDLKPLEDGDIELIIDASELYSHYTTCISSQEAARLPVQKLSDHEIPLQGSQAKMSTVAVYRTSWEVDEALQKYLDENLPPGKVRR